MSEEIIIPESGTKNRAKTLSSGNVSKNNIAGNDSTDLELINDSIGGSFQGITVFNDAVTCYNKGIVYEQKILTQNIEGAAVSCETEYNLYCMKLSKHGTSNANYRIAVVTPGHVLLPGGEIELYLIPSVDLIKDKPPLSSATCDEGALRAFLEKEFRIKSEIKDAKGKDKRTLSTEEMWQHFLASERIFELTTPIPLDELKNVNNIDNVIGLALTDGLKKDSDLVTFMKTQIPKPYPGLLSPDEYMPYAPNGIIVTNTKAGKTTTANRISKNVINRPTPSNLLGFSNADKSYTGLLDGQVDTCFIDEFTENLEENVSNGLLSYMERGTTKTARGHGITANGYSPIVFMGNPRIEGVNEYDLLDCLRNNLSQITCNPQALGSRMGFLIFDNNMDRATGVPYNNELSNKSLKVLKTIQEAFKENFTMLFRNQEVVQWLNEPFEDWYLNSLGEIANRSSLNEVKEFIRGLKDAHRHVRGTALHLAFVDSYGLLLNGVHFDIQALLTKSNKWHHDLITHTIETLNQIVSIKLDKSIYVKILESAPDYIKLITKTTFLDDSFLDSDMLPLDSFEGKFEGIASERGKYINFGNLKNTLLKNVAITNGLLKRFGLKFTDHNDIVLVGFHDKELYKIFRSAHKEPEGLQGLQD